MAELMNMPRTTVTMMKGVSQRACKPSTTLARRPRVTTSGMSVRQDEVTPAVLENAGGGSELTTAEHPDQRQQHDERDERLPARNRSSFRHDDIEREGERVHRLFLGPASSVNSAMR